MGYSPTIMFFPTYPEPQPAASVFVDLASDYRISTGVFQTAGGGPLVILEPGRKWSLGQREHPGRLSLGYWRLQDHVDRFDGDSDSATHGYYSVLEQSLWRSGTPAGNANRELSAFLQFGYANGEVSPFTRHLGGGAVLSAPFRRREADAAGLAATWVRFSQEPSAGFSEPAELVVESYYKIALTKRIAVVPDLQYLHHPGGVHSNRNCAVLTQRFTFAF
jgi:carbohydrate-selective porin OprB